jgi:Leucine-rich repeat (LRR) protein
MKNYLLLFTLCLTSLGLTGCGDYVYTFNDQTVFTPPKLFSGYALTDSALKSCTDQAIFDQKATKASQLTHLNCSNAGIANLAGLEIFTGLTHINLNGNNLTTIKPLLFLTQLQVVSLDINSLLDCNDGKQLATQVDGSTKLPAHCLR